MSELSQLSDLINWLWFLNFLFRFTSIVPTLPLSIWSSFPRNKVTRASSLLLTLISTIIYYAVLNLHIFYIGREEFIMSLTTTAVKEALSYRMCTKSGISTTFHLNVFHRRVSKKPWPPAGKPYTFWRCFSSRWSPCPYILAAYFQIEYWKSGK